MGRVKNVLVSSKKKKINLQGSSVESSSVQANRLRNRSNMASIKGRAKYFYNADNLLSIEVSRLKTHIYRILRVEHSQSAKEKKSIIVCGSCEIKFSR